MKLPPSRHWTPGWPRLSARPFDIVLFELPSANAAGLFQVTFLATKAPTVPVVVLGPTQDEAFAVEVIRAGAQEYFAKEEFGERPLEPVIRFALERHLEQAALLREQENYYGLFDHLVEGIFRTTPDGHYLLANVALARIYGYDSPVELMASIKDIGRSLYVDPARRDEFVRVMQTQRHHHRFRVPDLPQGRFQHLDLGKLPRGPRQPGQIALLRRHRRDITPGPAERDEPAQLGVTLPFAGRDHAPKRFPARSSGPVHFRQPAVLQVSQNQTRGHHRQNRF